MEVALIVAGGSGKRMQSDHPKQFLELGGRPILMHTIESFYHYSNSISIIVVLPESWIKEWSDLVKKHSFQIQHNVVSGGTSRTDSVRNGLELVSDLDIVAIHDGVRPFANKKVIAKAYNKASEFGNAVVSTELKESIRELTSKGDSKSVNRENYRIMQTPQVFRGALIKKAYERIANVDENFTDDASVAEFCGHTIFLVDGDYNNIKITTPEDLVVAESILKERKEH